MQKLDFNKDGKLVAYTDNGCTDGKSATTEVRGTFKASANPLNSIAMSKEQLQEVADLIAANILFCTKEVLTSDEAARYMGISKSYLYKLTMRGEIPHYKPMGKICYFNRAELEQWLQRNRCATATEIADRANRYAMKGGAQ